MNGRKSPKSRAYPCFIFLYNKFFVSVRFLVVITQLPVTIATNCRTLRGCMNVSSVTYHEGARSLLFKFILSIVLNNYWYFDVDMWSVVYYRESEKEFTHFKHLNRARKSPVFTTWNSYSESLSQYFCISLHFYLSSLCCSRNVRPVFGYHETDACAYLCGLNRNLRQFRYYVVKSVLSHLDLFSQ
jgi:hypothetical protein